MFTFFQSRDTGAQTIEDIFFDAPEELYEDALENQEVECVVSFSALPRNI